MKASERWTGIHCSSKMLIGDVVEAKVMKAKKNYGYARLMNVLTPSKDRVEEVVCPMARKCGGCQIQEMKYPAQLAFKEY